MNCIDITEIALVWGVSRQSAHTSLLRAMARGELAGQMVAGGWVFDRGEIVAWTDKHRPGTRWPISE